MIVCAYKEICCWGSKRTNIRTRGELNKFSKWATSIQFLTGIGGISYLTWYRISGTISRCNILKITMLSRYRYCKTRFDQRLFANLLLNVNKDFLCCFWHAQWGRYLDCVLINNKCVKMRMPDVCVMDSVMEKTFLNCRYSLHILSYKKFIEHYIYCTKMRPFVKNTSL